MRAYLALPLLLSLLLGCSGSTDRPAARSATSIPAPTDDAGRPVPTTPASGAPTIHGLHTARLALLESRDDGAEHVLELTNTGRRTDDYRVVVSPPDAASVQPHAVRLASGESVTVRVSATTAPSSTPPVARVSVVSRATGGELVAFDLPTPS